MRVVRVRQEMNVGRSWDWRNVGDRYVLVGEFG